MFNLRATLLASLTLTSLLAFTAKADEGVVRLADFRVAKGASEYFKAFEGVYLDGENITNADAGVLQDPTEDFEQAVVTRIFLQKEEGIFFLRIDQWLDGRVTRILDAPVNAFNIVDPEVTGSEGAIVYGDSEYYLRLDLPSPKIEVRTAGEPINKLSIELKDESSKGVSFGGDHRIPSQRLSREISSFVEESPYLNLQDVYFGLQKRTENTEKPVASRAFAEGRYKMGCVALLAPAAQAAF